MNASELLTTLETQGVQLQPDHNGKLKVRSPKGVLTPELQLALANHKQEILSILQLQQQEESANSNRNQAVCLATIGRLLGGFVDPIAPGFKPPIIDAQLMAKKLTVTFKPLPQGYRNSTVIEFRQELAAKLEAYGVKVEPWTEATTRFAYTINLPLIHWKWTIKTRAVRMRVNAVIDVERPLTLRDRLGILISESLYQLYAKFFLNGHPLSVARIAKLSSWAEEHAAKYIEDPNNTQVITLTELDEEFVNPSLPYQQKIRLGLNALVRTFSEIVIGVSSRKISILNMNLSDSVYARQNLDRFVIKSLIPKIFVPIAPLLLDRFEVGEYDPYAWDYAAKLVTLGQQLVNTGLFPPGYRLSQVLKRQSHRDIVNVIVNGRTGVSYGFVAYAEPPHYIGPRSLSATEWADLEPVPGFDPGQLRQNAIGRRYLKSQFQGEERYQQIPDLWIFSARSGANKTNLSLASDVLRIGLTGKLQLQLPQGSDPELEHIKPSYDIYVMLALTLGAALYLPHLVEQGAPMVHFHGYPAPEWFGPQEAYSGGQNPSVPCGTYESGIFNFLGIQRLANQSGPPLALVSLIEPDHGTNLMAANPDYLVKRIQAGAASGLIELGGRHFPSLQAHP